jgi:SAM-dependent methyltransferase
MQFAAILRRVPAIEFSFPAGAKLLAMAMPMAAFFGDREYRRARLVAWWNGDDPPPKPAPPRPAANDAPAAQAAPAKSHNWFALLRPLAAPLMRRWEEDERLRRRVLAWWIGEYLPEEKAPAVPEPPRPRVEAAPARVEPPPPAAAPAEVPVDALLEALAEAIAVPAERSPTTDPWTRERAKMVQWLWGDGYDFPGGAEFILELVRPLHLGGEHSILDLGCGIGSTTRAIASMLGCKIVGFESSPVLVSEAAVAAERAELAEQAHVWPMDLLQPELPERRFDAVLCRMALGAVPDFKTLLAEIDRRLAAGGQLLFTDQVLNAANSATLAVDAWQTIEDRTTHPVALEAITAELSRLGYDVRIAEDMSPAVRALVVGAWERVAGELKPGMFSAEEIDALNREMELWHRRVGVYDSGVLKFVRVLALKREI